MKKPTEWTESDLRELIGQPESSRLEFKSGKIFEKRDKATDDLSTLVSAFANAEGGTVILGMHETKGKERVAEFLDGVPADVTAQWLQQILTSNIRPELPGIRVSSVKTEQGLTCIVVHVPQGSTAYQARDRKYYSRFEFENRALEDHEIRLRMQRGRTACGELVIYDWTRGQSDKWSGESAQAGSVLEKLELQAAYQYGAPIRADQRGCWFRLGIRNLGELTLRDFVLHVTVSHSEGLIPAIYKDFVGNFAPHSHRFESGSLRVFPEDVVAFPPDIWTMIVAVDDASSQSLKFSWRLFF